MDTKLLNNLKSLQTELQATSSTNEKKSILQTRLNTDKELKDIVLTIYDPHKKFGVTTKRLKNFTKEIIKTKQYSIIDLLEELANRSLSGDKAINAILSYSKDYNDFKDIIFDIIDKDLKVHISKKGLLNAFNDDITRKMNFSVALAKLYDDKTKKRVDKSWFISRKLDGVRCLTIIKNGNVKFFFRSGKPILTLKKLADKIKELKLDNIVLDGEVAKIEDGKESFNGLMKEIRKKDHIMDNPRYFVFDVLTLEEFESGTSNRSLQTRMNERPDIKSDMIMYLKQTPYSKKEFDRMVQESIDKEWEGLILRKNTIYKGKRSNDILKVKHFDDDEFRVESIETGQIEIQNKKTGLYEKVHGMTNVIIKYKGTDVSVGTGFTHRERLDFMKHPEKIIGKLIRVRYMEESTNQNNNNISLRHTSFKGIIGEYRDT